MPPDHTKFIVGCISILAGISALAGGWLLWKGFTGGGELVMTVNTAIAGLVGFLSRNPARGPGDTNVAGDATINTGKPVQPFLTKP